MRTVIAALATAFLLAIPAYGDINVADGSDFGLGTQVSDTECDPTLVETYKCNRETSANATGASLLKRNLPSGIALSGEANMGLVYDGENLGIQHDVTIHIHFSTSTDNGLDAGGKISLNSN